MKKQAELLLAKEQKPRKTLEEVGKIILTTRKELQCSQVDLASAAGVSHLTVIKLEANDLVSKATLEEVQRVLHSLSMKLVIDGYWLYTHLSLAEYLKHGSMKAGSMANYMQTHKNKCAFIRIVHYGVRPRINILIEMLDSLGIHWDVVDITEGDKPLKTAKDYQEVAV